EGPPPAADRPPRPGAHDRSRPSGRPPGEYGVTVLLREGAGAEPDIPAEIGPLLLPASQLAPGLLLGGDHELDVEVEVRAGVGPRELRERDEALAQRRRQVAIERAQTQRAEPDAELARDVPDPPPQDDVPAQAVVLAGRTPEAGQHRAVSLLE